MRVDVMVVRHSRMFDYIEERQLVFKERMHDRLNAGRDAQPPLCSLYVGVNGTFCESNDSCDLPVAFTLCGELQALSFAIAEAQTGTAQDYGVGSLPDQCLVHESRHDMHGATV